MQTTLKAPPKPEPAVKLKLHNVNLDDETWLFLKEVGSGNASLGIRYLVKHAKEKLNEPPR